MRLPKSVWGTDSTERLETTNVLCIYTEYPHARTHTHSRGLWFTDVQLSIKILIKY